MVLCGFIGVGSTQLKTVWFYQRLTSSRKFFEVSIFMKIKISVISPSYNQVDFVSKLLGSVASQDYPHFEHLIFDGLSTDGSHEVIERYAARYNNVTYVHEVDRGQVHAINKGLAAATGDVLTWINSDDYYASEDVLRSIALFFANNPDVDVVYGRGNRVDETGKKLSEAYIHPDGTDMAVALQHSLGLLQPSLFFRRRVFDRIGGLDETYNLQLDYEYWIRMAQAGFKFKRIDKLLSNATVHANAKSTGQRLAQLNECLHLVSSKFGYLPRSWASRYAEFYVTRLDAKVVKGIVLDAEASAQRDGIQRALIASFNSTSKARDVLTRDLSVEPIADVADYMMRSGISPSSARRIVITSFDSHYFHQGLNLIASLHRTSFETIDKIFVYSLNLDQREVHTLESLEKVTVLQYPDEAADIFPGYMDPRHRAYKPLAIKGPDSLLRDGDLVLWMDAGLSALDGMLKVFDLIDTGDFFMADHDEKQAWPFYNINFMHSSAQAAFNPSNDELLAPHMCSCMVGYRRGGRFQRLIDEAFQYGCRPEIVMWPKNIPAKEKYKPRLDAEQTELRDGMLQGSIRANDYPREEVRTLFPYFGHRTQSIYSILVYRYGAPTFSGSIYRRSNDISSQASMVNWGSSANDTRSASSDLNLQDQDASVIVYHHRGVYNNLSGLRYRRKGSEVFILGNGPSLKGAPFDELRKYATIGMNAAYRFWDRVGFYPDYYCCLDTVVLESHKVEIHRLIQDADSLGIRKFLLRKEFADFYPEMLRHPRVLFLEDLAQDVPMFRLDKITTGSFSLLFALFLGYRDVYLLGIDLNYVEQLPEAELKGGRVLEITADPAGNPNYFFDDYQQKGDRYNPPNRHPNMHIRSWNNIKDFLEKFPIRVRNLNRESALQCFEFDDLQRVLRTLQSPFFSTERVAVEALQSMREKAFWRSKILSDIDECHRRFSKKQVAVTKAPEDKVEYQYVRLARVESRGGFVSNSEGSWGIRRGAENTGVIRAVFQASGIAGRTFVGGVWVRSSKPVMAKVVFGHLGQASHHERTGRTYGLKSGVLQFVRVRKKFVHDHANIKLELQVSDLNECEEVDIEFYGASVVEATVSIQGRCVEHIPMSIANKLYREGDYATALGLYLYLKSTYGLDMYGRNAVRSATKLGMEPDITIQDLLEFYR